MAAIRLVGVHKAFGPTPVLRGVDIEVGDGEYVVLIGPSGCGKSTLLRVVAGLETPSAGEVWMGGRRVDALAPKDRDVAMVFQSYALYPHMVVRENMGFALRIRGLPPAAVAARVEEVAALLGLSSLLDRLPSALSGGQRQRVAMGRAIVREPAAFLFDEPLSNLDPGLRAELRLELKRLHRRLGATFVHVTHDPVEALTLADRIVVLDRGRVSMAGTPTEMIERPANRFVARFIGTPTMNLVAGEADGTTAAVPGTGWRWPTDRRGPVSFGFRPDEASLVAGDEGVVDVIERVGAEAIVHLRLVSGLMVQVVARGDLPEVGSRHAIAIRRAHVLEPA